MKKITLLVAATSAFTLLLAGCSNEAQETSAKPSSIAQAPRTVPKKVVAPELKPPTPEQIRSSLVSKYDLNKDKAVTPQEVLSITVYDLMKFSTRNDKTLNQGEFHLALGDTEQKDEEMTAVFKTIDTDKNQFISESEISAYIWPSVQAMAQKTGK